VLSASDARAATRRCAERLGADRTSTRLAGALPLQNHEERLAVVGWPSAVADALDERPDIDVVAIVDEGHFTLSRKAERRAELIDPWELADGHVSLLLVGAHAFDLRRVLVDRAAADALAEVPGNVDVWLVGGVGRALPPALFDRVRAAAGADDTLCEVALERFDRVIGDSGLVTTSDAASRADCPVAPELLRPLD
jgi:hypothetical protein